MNFCNDKRTVMMLDAVGTSLVFTVIQGSEQITVGLPGNAINHHKCVLRLEMVSLK